MKNFDGSGYIILKENGKLFCRELTELSLEVDDMHKPQSFTAHFKLGDEWSNSKYISAFAAYLSGNKYFQDLLNKIQDKEQQLKNIELKIEEETKRLNNIQNANCSLMSALEKMTNEAKSELENVNNRIERLKYNNN